jgi:hypothetical protein
MAYLFYLADKPMKPTAIVEAVGIGSGHGERSIKAALIILIGILKELKITTSNQNHELV